MLFITTVIASLLPLSLCFSFSRAFMPLSKDVRIKVHIGKFQISLVGLFQLTQVNDFK